MSYRGRAQHGQNYRGRSQYDQNYRGDFRKKTLEECKIIEVRILEVDIEVTLGMIILKEVKVGPGKDSTQINLGEMKEAAVD